ncbi:MAG: hypothetical protein KJ077_12155 [Anaerolineae bacterium]|nr:hypothetical protein [Anaerolineae bacterium]
MEAEGKGSRSEQPDEGDEQVNQQGFAAAVGGKEEDGAAALHQADSVEAVDGRVEEETEGMVGQAVEAKEEGDEGDGDEGQPEGEFSILDNEWWFDGVLAPLNPPRGGTRLVLPPLGGARGGQYPTLSRNFL